MTVFKAGSRGRDSRPECREVHSAVTKLLAKAAELLVLAGMSAFPVSADYGYFWCLSLVGGQGSYYSDVFGGDENQSFAYEGEFASYLDRTGVRSTDFGGAVCYFHPNRGAAEEELASRSHQERRLFPGYPVKLTGWKSGTGERPTEGGRTAGSGFLCSFNPRMQEAEGFLGGLFDRYGPCPTEGGRQWGSHFTGSRKSRLERLIEARGLRPDRFIAAENPSNIPNWRDNALAFTCRDRDGSVKKAIVWDVAFMESLDRKADSPWASVAVLAHEIAHHANSDTVQDNIPAPQRRQQELHADKWAGFALAQLGVAKSDAVAVFGLLGDGGTTHPSARERLKWASEGWVAGASQDPDRRRTDDRFPPDYDDDRDVVPPPPPPPPKVAKYCVTDWGVCPMGQSLPPGQPCYCPSAYGPVWGKTQ